MTDVLAARFWLWLAIAALGAALGACENDPVERDLVGTWQAAVASSAGAIELRFTTLSNGQYRIEYSGAGAPPEESGYFAAQDGEWRKERMAGGIEEGTYEFLGDDSVLFQSGASGAVVWTRVANAAVAGGADAGTSPAATVAGGDLLSAGPFGAPLAGVPAVGTAAAAVQGAASATPAPLTGGPSGMPTAPAPFGTASMAGAPLFAPPPELVGTAAAGTAALTGNLGAASGQAVQNAIATGARAAADLDTDALAELPGQTLNDLEGSARQAAAGVVDEAAGEAERKVGERIQNVTQNAASRVRNFFTRGRRDRDEENEEQ